LKLDEEQEPDYDEWKEPAMDGHHECDDKARPHSPSYKADEY
jgi:hypothetical protein